MYVLRTLLGGQMAGVQLVFMLFGLEHWRCIDATLPLRWPNGKLRLFLVSPVAELHVGAADGAEANPYGGFSSRARPC